MDEGGEEKEEHDGDTKEAHVGGSDGSCQWMTRPIAPAQGSSTSPSIERSRTRVGFSCFKRSFTLSKKKSIN